MAEVSVQFDGARYGYWERVRIRESVDDLCASVQLALAAAGDGPFPLDANTVAKVLIGDTLVSTVRADSLTRDESATQYAIALEARSLGRELVDCQYSKTLSGLKLSEIVKRICDLFKVPVQIEAETAVVPHFSMQCEIPANALINAVRAANLLLYPRPDGGLILTEPTASAAVTTLVEGQHFTRHRIVDEFKLRYSEYHVKSFDYSADASLRGGVSDSGLNFFRPMHIIADRAGTGLGGCDRRAELERNRRLARAHRIELEVPGWQHPGGVWAINTQVGVQIPRRGVDDVFLIGERELVLDDQGGEVTLLQLMRREAFLGQEKKHARRGSGVKKVKP